MSARAVESAVVAEAKRRRLPPAVVALHAAVVALNRRCGSDLDALVAAAVRACLTTMMRAHRGGPFGEARHLAHDLEQHARDATPPAALPPNVTSLAAWRARADGGR